MFRRERVSAVIALGAVVVSVAAGVVFDASAQGANPLTVQTTTGRVGIGTTNPAFPLDVNGVASAQAFRGQSAATASSVGGNLGVGTAAPASSVAASRFVSVENTAGLSTVELDKPNAAISESVGGLIFNRAGVRLAGIFAGTDGATNDGSFVFTVTNAGTSAGRMWLDKNGTLTATTKNFEIPHPLTPTNAVLTHSVLEGPEIAVFYRGEAALTAGEAVVTLPPYFEALTRPEGRTIQLTAVGGWSPLYVVGDIVAGAFWVRASTGNPGQRFFWEVKAVRADVPPLVVERTGTLRKWANE
jgi:hypothetical protein